MGLFGRRGGRPCGERCSPWARSESNRRPAGYEPAAPPLSYGPPARDRGGLRLPFGGVDRTLGDLWGPPGRGGLAQSDSVSPVRALPSGEARGPSAPLSPPESYRRVLPLPQAESFPPERGRTGRLQRRPGSTPLEPVPSVPAIGSGAIPPEGSAAARSLEEGRSFRPSIRTADLSVNSRSLYR